MASVAGRSDSEAGETLVLGAGMLLVHLGRVCRARRPRSPSSSSPSSKCGARVRRAGSICGITFTFTNRCGDTVWPGLLSGSRTPPLETTGFALASGQLRSLYAPQGWSGRFWGRSGCTFDASGKGSCATGDCGSDFDYIEEDWLKGSLEEMSESCRSFFGRLNESLLVWGSKLPVESRACYSKMAEELCALLVDTPSETLNLPMGCLLTMLNAPVPDESRSSYLQDALFVFTEILCSDP
ncbi:Nuclear pore complex protein NUP96 [Zea mays]|uniref:Nuclear pore complex protein NUP96 n=1 Tax=Zea mays TaxID=4577 RepID=A0A3L6FZ01_MAIZE|nr:Nuclear pore complex protein NUP96 [Zea mays]